MIRFFECLACECHIMTKGKTAKVCPSCMEYKGIKEITEKQFREW